MNCCMPRDIGGIIPTTRFWRRVGMNDPMNETTRVESFNSPEALVNGVAARFGDWLTVQPAARTVALSGGRISKGLFSTLAAAESPVRERLAQLHYFWADERCVPLDDPESNYRLASELLFEPASIPQSQRHPFAGGAAPAEMAAAGQTMMQDFFQSEAGTDPVFDLVFLGMGEDGHVASLFPENLPNDEQRTESCYHVVASKPPPDRITLSFPVLVAAREVWLVISGAGKAERLAGALSGRDRSPLQALLAQRQQTHIFTDIQLPV